MITRRDIDAYLTGLLPEKGPIIAAMLDSAIRASLTWYTARYDEMDEEAKAYVDTAFNAILESAGERISRMPDSPTKRKLRRIQKTEPNQHIVVEQLLRQLEASPSNLAEAAVDAERLVLDALQGVVDLLFDIKEHPLGNERLVCISLLYACVDEMLVAVHLARHHYYVQANAHLRTVLETIDKVQLFSEQPQWVELWTSDDFKRRQRELEPNVVRKKLGRETYDPVYSYLSEHGTHTTFRTFQARTYRSVAPSASGRYTARVCVGGSPVEHLQIWFYLFAMSSVTQLLNRVAKFGRGAVNQEEAAELIDQQVAAILGLNAESLIPWAESHGLDTSEMREFLASVQVG